MHCAVFYHNDYKVLTWKLVRKALVRWSLYQLTNTKFIIRFDKVYVRRLVVPFYSQTKLVAVIVFKMHFYREKCKFNYDIQCLLLQLSTYIQRQRRLEEPPNEIVEEAPGVSHFEIEFNGIDILSRIPVWPHMYICASKRNLRKRNDNLTWNVSFSLAL